jgi:tetratricopeptide (TPR) repeat protein
MRLAALLVMSSSAIAFAQPSPGAKLFEEGRELAKQGKYVEACDRFDKSYALDNGVGTELNLADCQEHLGHFAAAWRMFDEAGERSADNPVRQKFAHDRAQALLGKVAVAVVKLAEPLPAGIAVTIAGRVVKPAAEIDEKVDPGAVAVHVAVPGKPAYDRTQTVAAGAKVVFDVEAAAATGGTGAPPTEAVAPVMAVDQTSTERRHGRVVAAYAVGAGGLITLAVGVGLGIKASSDYDNAVKNCTMTGDQPVCDATSYSAARSAGSLADAGTVVGAVGVAAIVAGAIVYFTAPRDLVVSPTASARSAGLAISGTF